MQPKLNSRRYSCNTLVSIIVGNLPIADIVQPWIYCHCLSHFNYCNVPYVPVYVREPASPSSQGISLLIERLWVDSWSLHFGIIVSLCKQLYSHCASIPICINRDLGGLVPIEEGAGA